MAVHQIEMIDDYVKYLQKMPSEVEALFRDLLIGVTSFFRDPEAFKALEEQNVPRLFDGKPAGGTIRVWSPGCSTGEEAYSIAILLQDLNGRIIAWNPAAVRMYGWSEAEALAMNAHDRIPEKLQEEVLAKVYQLGRAEILEPYRTRRIAKDGTAVEIWMTATALINETGKMYAISTTERPTKKGADQTNEEGKP